MRARLLALIVAAALAGCATLPDGSRITRLPEGDLGLAPTLPPEQARALSELNAQILREQDGAREREARAQAAPPPYAAPWGLYPYLDGSWVWSSRHGWRPRFGLGFGWYGPWPR